MEAAAANAPRTPRPTAVVIGEALEELRARERRLLKVTAELAEVRKAIRQLAKAGAEAARPPSVPRREPADETPKGETRQAIIAALAIAPEPLSMPEVAERIGRPAAGWIGAQLARMAGAGELVEASEGRYGIPTPGAA